MEIKPGPISKNELKSAAQDVETAKKWAEIESNFLNRWMNRRLWKRWEEHLQDTSPHKESS